MTEIYLAARAAISDRLAACTQAGDARKADAYAECFTRDGVLQLAETITGREAIREWMRAPSVIPQAQDGPRGFVSHHLTTCHIKLLDETTATARTYWLVTSPRGLDHNGYYDDQFRKDGGDWLIAHRRPRTLWVSPDSLLHSSSEP